MILKANPQHAEEITDLFRTATDGMIASGIDQWNYSYPLISHISEDIEQGSAFIMMEKGSILATVTLDGNQDEQYQKIRWPFVSPRPLVIHRLAVHPDGQGQGLGKKMCHFAQEFAAANRFTSIRLDAYSKNPVSLRLYHNLGYTKAGGYCYFHKNPAPFYCFEKMT